MSLQKSFSFRYEMVFAKFKKLSQSFNNFVRDSLLPSQMPQMWTLLGERVGFEKDNH